MVGKDGGRRGRELLAGVGLQSAVNCLLGGWCDIKLVAHLAASELTMSAGQRVSCADALMWSLSDLGNHNSALNCTS